MPNGKLEDAAWGERPTRSPDQTELGKPANADRMVSGARASLQGLGEAQDAGISSCVSVDLGVFFKSDAGWEYRSACSRLHAQSETSTDLDEVGHEGRIIRAQWWV